MSSLLSRSAQLLAITAFLAASWFAFPASAATGSCAPATGRGANGPADYVGYCWVDFAGYNDTIARSASGQPFTINLDGGGTLGFNLKVTVNSPGAAFEAASAPSWTGAPLGASAFTGIPGMPVLYQATDGTTTTVTLSGITVVVGGGQVPYAFVASDAESTNNGETLRFTTNGQAWTTLATMRNGTSLVFPALSGQNTQTVIETGVAGTVGAYAFASEGNPTTISSTMVGSGLQGIAFAVKYRAADMSITKTHGGGFAIGGTGAYTLTVRNNGPDANQAANTIRVTDTLPAGLTYASAGGTGWACNAVGQVVTCTRGGTAAVGSNLPPIMVNVNVVDGAAASVVNTATVAVPSGYDPNTGSNTANDPTTILRPDLSTSTKTVMDLNGGDAVPGDTLRYTITVRESAGIAASGVSVTDHIPAGISGFTVVGTPADSTNASISTGGANGAGIVGVTGITVTANGSVSIVFDATISSGAATGLSINNIATVTNPNGTGATPGVAITIAQPQPPASGNKLLYIYNGTSDATRAMTRTPQPAGGAANTIARNGYAEWRLAPALQKDLVIQGGSTIGVSLLVQCVDNFIGWFCLDTGNLSWKAELYDNTVSPATLIGASGNVTFDNVAYGSRTANIGIGAGDVQIAAGHTLILRITNTSGASRSMRIQQRSGTTLSVASMDVSTVINVDSVLPYAAAYNSTATVDGYAPGETVHVRAVVSDPFGFGDVNGADIVIRDSAGTMRLGSTPMVAMAGSGAQRIYEYAYVVPANPPLGAWTATVTAKEGTEGTVTHTGKGSFIISGKVTLTKAWGAGATSGDTVSLSIAGGAGATAGSSTAPSTTTAATARAAGGTPVILTEAFVVGDAGSYSPNLACVMDGTGTSVAVSGTGPSRVINMPVAASVTCTWHNARTIPLTVVKLSTVVSDPVNGTIHPKAIPGAIIEYRIIVTNPAPNPVDADSVVVTDTLPAEMELWVGDLGGPGPVTFSNGSPSSGMSYTFVSLSDPSDDLSFSANGGSTWNHTPSGSTTDPAVDAIRINPRGVFNANNAQFDVKFRARLK